MGEAVNHQLQYVSLSNDLIHKMSRLEAITEMSNHVKLCILYTNSLGQSQIEF